MQVEGTPSIAWVLTLVPSAYHGVFATAYLERLGTPPNGILIFDIDSAPAPRTSGQPYRCRRIRRRESGKKYGQLPDRTHNEHRERVDGWLNDIVRDYDAMHPSPPLPSIFEGLENDDG